MDFDEFYLESIAYVYLYAPQDSNEERHSREMLKHACLRLGKDMGTVMDQAEERLEAEKGEFVGVAE